MIVYMGKNLVTDGIVWDKKTHRVVSANAVTMLQDLALLQKKTAP